jgi:hypothetical protein
VLTRLDSLLGYGAAVQEAMALVAGFHDVAVMGQAVQQRGRHLGVAEHGIRQRRDLSMLKTPKRREWLEIFAPPPYRGEHDHDDLRLHFAALVPLS